jgi:hypothetical protein
MLVLDTVRRQWILGHAVPPQENLQLVGVLQHLDILTLGAWHPVEIGVEVHVAILIRTPLVDLIGRRQMRGQFRQKAPFEFEGFGGNQPCLSHRAVLHPHRRPLPRLLVEVFQALKGAAGQEVRFHGPKSAFVPSFSITMPQGMADELEAVTLREFGHLRDDDGLFSRPPQPCQIGVVDNASPGTVAPEHQRLVQKTFHDKAVENAVELQVASL